ncbi:Hypothetical predicted protein, partial [Paramuricea clavata]
MVNVSLTTGHFPNAWKEALVSPLFKKGCEYMEYKNLRPISDLQFVSKITERAASDQIYNHILANNVFPPLQSAYRKHHSTETALLKVINDIHVNMNNQQVTLLVFLDLSSAFDTVDYNILINRIQTSFRITDTALLWLKSYLLAALYVSLLTKVHRKALTCLTVFHSPQGSCLDPLLFTVYASKLFEVVKHHLPNAHAYADDTKLYLAFKSETTQCQEDAMEAMEKCIKA